MRLEQLQQREPSHLDNVDPTQRAAMEEQVRDGWEVPPPDWAGLDATLGAGLSPATGDATLVELPTGHWPMLSEPARLASALAGCGDRWFPAGPGATLGDLPASRDHEAARAAAKRLSPGVRR
jgi:hypothetical protein